MFAGIEIGGRIFVQHVEEDEWHEFEVTGKTSDGYLVILTGDEDHYVLTAGDVSRVVPARGAALPLSVRQDGGLVNRLGLRYNAAQRRRVQAEAARIVEEYERELPPRVPAAPEEAGDSIWIAVEPLGGLSVGEPVLLREGDVRMENFALIRRGADVVKAMAVPLANLSDEVERIRAQHQGWSTPRVLPAVGQASGEGDIRTLAVDYDSQGERYKDWRSVCAEIHWEETDNFPIDGPPSVVFLAKHMQRHGGCPRGWVELFIREKGLSASDRVVHELRVLTEVLFLAGTFDQLNLPVLSSLEFVSRRLQAIMDAHAVNPQKPNYESAGLFSGSVRPADAIAPELRSYVARRARDEAEIEKSRQKVRELKTGGRKGDSPQASK